MASRPRMEIKVYLVCQFLNLVEPGRANVHIVNAFLTRSAAQRIVDEKPGTFIEKHIAVK